MNAPATLLEWAKKQLALHPAASDGHPVLDYRGADGEHRVTLGELREWVRESARSEPSPLARGYQEAERSRRRLAEKEADRDLIEQATAELHAALYPEHVTSTLSDWSGRLIGLVRVAAASFAPSPHDRWEAGIRNIVTILHGPQHPFEIQDIVEEVRALKAADEDAESDLKLLRAALAAGAGSTVAPQRFESIRRFDGMPGEDDPTMRAMATALAGGPVDERYVKAVSYRSDDLRVAFAAADAARDERDGLGAQLTGADTVLARIHGVLGRHPLPWAVTSEEPYDLTISDSGGRKIDGLEAWLDDACNDGNNEREQNVRFIVDAVNATRISPIQDGAPAQRPSMTGTIFRVMREALDGKLTRASIDVDAEADAIVQTILARNAELNAVHVDLGAKVEELEETKGALERTAAEYGDMSKMLVAESRRANENEVRLTTANQALFDAGAAVQAATAGQQVYLAEIEALERWVAGKGSLNPDGRSSSRLADALLPWLEKNDDRVATAAATAAEARASAVAERRLREAADGYENALQQISSLIRLNPEKHLKEIQTIVDGTRKT